MEGLKGAGGLRVINRDNVSKRIAATATTIAGETAVVIVDKTPFDDDAVAQALAAPESVQTFQNAQYSKHTVPMSDHWRVEVICPASQRDIDKYSRQNARLVRETPAIHQLVVKPFVDAIPKEAITWVYNILDGKKEAENVILDTKDYMLVKDYKWSDESMVEGLHVLGMPKEKGRLASIRDLRATDLEMLMQLRQQGLETISSKYAIPQHSIRAYLHYLPTFWHLHVHFDHVMADSSTHSVGKAYLLDDVIDHLQRDGDYFATCNLTFRAGGAKDEAILRAIDAIPSSGAAAPH